MCRSSKIPYTHNTTHVIILPLEIIIIIHYTIRLTYNTFNNHLLREGYALLKCFSFGTVFSQSLVVVVAEAIKYSHGGAQNDEGNGQRVDPVSNAQIQSYPAIILRSLPLILLDGMVCLIEVTITVEVIEK